MIIGKVHPSSFSAEVETAFANYTYSVANVCTPLLPAFYLATTALIIHTLEYFSWKHAQRLSLCFGILLNDLGCCSLPVLCISLHLLLITVRYLNVLLWGRWP